jgi:hypothetical protein
MKGTAITTTSMASFMFGATYHVGFGGLMGLEVDALYQNQGVSATVSGVDTAGSGNYLTLPSL